MNIQDGVKLAQGSILSVGKSGHIEGDGTLYGAFTRFEAPHKSVFGNKLTIAGDWVTDSGVQTCWFDINTTSFGNKAIIDDALTINAAIEMAKSGPVYLEGKVYNILSTIHISAGIRLIGVSSIRPATEGVRNTVLRAAENFNPDFMVAINAQKVRNTYQDNPRKNWEWKVAYPTSGTSLEHIILDCHSMDYYRVNGIVAGGGFTLNQVLWRNLAQGIASTDNYADNRRIIQCEFVHDKNEIDYNDTLPAFDLCVNGDNLVIEQTNIYKVGAAALKIGNNAGSSIRNCVLNGPVLIYSGKSVDFTANHMECFFKNRRDTRLVIRNSSVNINACYFDKCSEEETAWNGQPRPLASVQIDDIEADYSIVNISNCVFLFSSGKPTTSANTLSERTKRLQTMSQFDISISPKTILSVVDCFRYQVTNLDFFLAQSTFGIWICDNNGKPLKSFNTVSQQLSQRSDIFALKIASQIPPLPYSSASDVSYLASNSGILWAAPTESSITYSYRYLKEDEEITPDSVLKSLMGGKEFDKVHGESGIHMTLGATTVGNKGRLLLKRTGSLGSKYVILPMCGAKVAFDNGISIAGYKWVDSISEL